MRRPTWLRRAVVAALAGLTLFATAAVANPTPANAQAYPTTSYVVRGDRTIATGTITWMNRSVHIQGSVSDTYSDGQASMVEFSFDVVDQRQTRSTGDGQRRDYNFAVQGPRGGIGLVQVFVQSGESLDYAELRIYKRP